MSDPTIRLTLDALKVSGVIAVDGMGRSATWRRLDRPSRPPQRSPYEPPWWAKSPDPIRAQRLAVTMMVVASPVDEDAIRAAALEWVERVTFDGELHVERRTLANDFLVAGERFPLVDRGRGIRRPAGWRAALSILTAAVGNGPRPYDDAEGLDGLHRYKLRRDDGGTAENAGLRAAMAESLPLMWFYGVAPGVFQVISPVWLVAEEPAHDQFVVALTPEQRGVAPGSVVEETMRRYLVRQTRQRLHQRVFASRVMVAYETRCAVCSLAHRPLLDAAHIVADRDEGGIATVTNGLALCKIHHAAYDRNILGIRPDLVVEVHERLLAEVDGPMLRYGLQEHHGKALMAVPRRRAERPDPVRLERRYETFRAA